MADTGKLQGMHPCRFIWLVLLLLLASCAGGTAPVNPDQPALPGLPPNPAPRTALAVSEHLFLETDELASSNMFWDGSSMNLDEPALAWCIVGLDVDDEPLNSLAVNGSMDGLYVAVSDYGNGRWRYIGSRLTEDALIALPEGDFTNEAGSVFFAIIAPLAAYGQVQCTLSYGVPSTDTTPPAWTDGEGIISVDASEYWVRLDWHEAVDSVSPPVEYLIYQAHSAEGIDWETPQYVVPAGFLSTHISVPEENPNPFDYAVRARDAVGNVTTNTNIVAASYSEAPSSPIADWLPGDRLELSWQDHEADSRLLLLGPDFSEGFPDGPEGMAGMVQFSLDSADSGLALETATLLETAPEGGYLLEVHSEPDQTYSVRLYDSAGALKQDLGNVTPGFSGALDYVYLRHGSGSWPQAGEVEAGQRLEISWDDAELDVSLQVQAPSYEQGSPAFPEDLMDRLDFSQENLDSLTAVEWIRFTELADPGEYGFAIVWEHTEADNPATLAVNWVVLDDLDNIVMGPGQVTLRDRGEEFFVDYLDTFFWLEYPES